MAIVVDANVPVILVSGDPRQEAAQDRIRQWLVASEEIHAPSLLPYEVANALTRLVASGALRADRIDRAWRTALSIPISYHPLAAEGDRVVSIALKLRRQTAYDAAYIALAERLGAEVWTFDGPLARNATSSGCPVRLIE